MDQQEKNKLLEYLKTPKTIYEVCAYMLWSFSKSHQTLNIMVAGMELRKVKTMGKRIVYHSFQEET